MAANPMSDFEMRPRSFLSFWGASLKESFSVGWIVFGVLSTAMPAIITLIQRHLPQDAAIVWVKWISNNQAEIQVCIALLVLAVYLAYAPYKFYKDHANRAVALIQSKEKQLQERADEIKVLRTRLECPHEVGKAVFRDTISKMQGKLELMKETPEWFVEQSISELAAPVHVVMEHISDKKGLQQLWEDYKRLEEDSDNRTRSMLQFMMLERGVPREKCGEEILKMLYDYLNRFKDFSK